MKKMCVGLLCLFSFAAAPYMVLPNHLVYTGRSLGAGKHFMEMDGGFNAKKLSYESAGLSLAYAFGFEKWDLGLSASYVLSNDAWHLLLFKNIIFFPEIILIWA